MSSKRAPRRLAQDPLLRAFLETARDDDTPEALARIEASLAIAMTSPPATASPPATPAPSRGPVEGATAIGAGAKAAGLAALLAIAAVVSISWLGEEEPPAPAPRAHPRQEATQPPVLVAPDEPEESPSIAPAVREEPPAPRIRRQRPARPSAPSQPASEDDPGPASMPARSIPPLAEELELLSRARAELAHDPARALELTELHRARFGDGARLGAERERIATRAREALGGASTP